MTHNGNDYQPLTRDELSKLAGEELPERAAMSLVMYAATNYAAVRYLWSLRRRSVLLPALGVVVAGYVLFRNLWPPPEGSLRVVPYLVLGWLIAGALRLAVGISRRSVRLIG